MPGKVKVRILAGRNLPVMDKSSDTSDAFAEVKLGNTTYKTEVFRRSLNPYWNSEWFRFEADDEDLQDEPLQIRIMDYDTYSANDAIGKVYIDLNPLLHKDSGHIMFGWFPIYDTMHGIRGEVHLAVKVDLFSDSNRYRQSSCGVRFFYSPGVPNNYVCQAVLGFVEELVVNDDPEYQWIDKIRTPRASNEARQTLFSKLSGEVQRKIGLKALDLGGNAVIGYKQCFDLEGESGIVVRGIGTAVILVKSDLLSSRKHHNFGSTPTGPSTKIDDTSDIMTPYCLSPLLDGLSLDHPSQQTSIYWPSCHLINPCASPPIPPVAFLSQCDISSSFPCCYSRNSSPSPSTTVRSSPVPFANNSHPRISLWLNKLAKSVATPVQQRRYFSGTATLPRAKGVRTGVSSEIELGSLCRYYTDKNSPKGVSKTVQVHGKLSRHNSFNLPTACCNTPALLSNVSKPSTQVSSTTSHPISIVRFPTSNSVATEDHSHNFAAYKASSLLSCSPSEPSGTPITPLTAPPIMCPIVPLITPLNGTKHCTTSPKSSGTVIHRRGSSDPDLSTTPNCGSNHSSGSGSAGNKSGYKFIISPEGIHLLEYPFITMKQLPVGLVQHIGGVVSSRSVKILDQINNPDDPETRDAWWMELRKEVRSHCRALSCNAVLGYSESTNICDEVVVLSASGTAVLLNAEKEKKDLDVTPHSVKIPSKSDSGAQAPTVGDMAGHHSNCALCHIPYSESMVPFPASLSKCAICRKGKVPDVLFMTIEPPPDILITGIGCLIQARVCRYKRDSKGEQCAKETSDSLPFLEYELHRQLLSKLKMKGMNGIFGLTIQIAVGDNLLIALATGTGAFISALPPPLPPQISSGKGVDTSKLTEIQKLITQNINKNREHYGLTGIPNAYETQLENNIKAHSKEYFYNDNIAFKGNNMCLDPALIAGDSADELDLAKKGQVLLEVDDTEDADIISLMIDSDVPEGYEVCNTEIMPGLGHLYVCSLQTFSQVYRAKLNTCKQFAQQFDWIVQSLFVKLRRLVPCCLTDLKFTVDLPEADLVQLTVMGSVVGLGGPPAKVTAHIHPNQRKRTHSIHDQSDELLFSMDEDHKTNDSLNDSQQGSGVKETNYHVSPMEHPGVELTPLSFVPDAHIHYYLGNLDFFFIRESTSIRESGGLNGFMHSFLSEVFAIVRAHVAALGGNAMTALHLTQCVLLYNPHKNQAQCLVNIAGDAVMVHYNNSKTVTGLNRLHTELNANESIINEENENHAHL